MSFLQALTFTTPLALAALLLLPVIWWLLRFTPPKPETVRFPPLRLLLDLVNREEQPDKTPWWLMLLRLAIAALVILGVSHPLYAPGRVDTLSQRTAAAGGRRYLGRGEGLGQARGGSERDSRWRAERRCRCVACHDGAAAAAASARAAIAAMTCARVSRQLRTAGARSRPRADCSTGCAISFGNAAALRVIWLSDGIDDGAGASFAAGLTTLANGTATVEAILPETSALPLALAAPGFDGGRIKVTALRADDGAARGARAVARASNGRSAGEAESELRGRRRARLQGVIELPVELRNEIARIEIEGERNAAAVI